MKRISHRGFLIVRRLMLATALVGLFASTYLLITYVTGKPIVCGTASGCELVRASPQAKTVFGLPTPLLGVVFYLAVIALLVARVYVHRRSEMWNKAILAVTGIGFAESAWLFLVQAYQIRAFCTWCLVSGACSTILFASAFFEGEREPEAKEVVAELKWTFYALLISVLGGGLILWTLLSRQVDGTLPVLKPSAVNSSGMQRIVPDGTPTRGLATSTVTVTEFLDIECSACRAFRPVMQKIEEEYAGRVRFAQRLFPLIEFHTHARAAAISAVCAGRQGKYFEFVNAALLNQQSLERTDLVRYAEALKLDAKAFEACIDDTAVADLVDAERVAGERIGIDSTPTLFVNDEILDGVPNYEQFKRILDEKLK